MDDGQKGRGERWVKSNQNALDTGMNLSKNTFDKSHNKMNEKYAPCTLMQNFA